MLDLLASSPLLTIMLVVAIGTLVGLIPFGPVTFGSAGALFVGLAFGALDPRLGEGLKLVQTLGLALFVYTVGIASGASFFRGIRRQLPLMVGSVLVLLVSTVTVIVAGLVTGLSASLQGGVFAGSLNSTPTLAAALVKAGTEEPAVGYAITYPFGVLLSIVAVAVVFSRPWQSVKDPPPASGQVLTDLTIAVGRRARTRDIPGFREHRIRFSYLARDGQVRVAEPDEEFLPGDRVVIIGPAPAVQVAVDFLGERVAQHLAQDRSKVDYRRILISNSRIAGRTIGELDVPGRFKGMVSRVRRGDVDLLAYDDLVIELGDRLRVVVPREEIEDVSHYLGDSERKVSEVDALSLGIGLAIGLLIGLIVVPLPGGIKLSLGAAAGPLIVGMVLGRLERTGPIVWFLPTSANLTIRQLGLLLFLATTGLASGQAFASQAFSWEGLTILAVGLVVTTVSAVLLLVVARLLGVSSARAAGALAGFDGQPAILAFANDKLADERINGGYSALFAIGMIAKILLVQIIVS
jgi:putative transport protein